MNIYDLECQPLIRAINFISGIYTIESCCGHGDDPFRIWFRVDDLSSLPDLLYWLDACHCGYYDWHVTVSTDCAKSPVTFLIEGPVGKESYEQSIEIAKLLIEDIGE